MADQQRWFKLWYSAGSDDSLSSLPPDLRWAWAMLGAHTKMHGVHGRVQISRENSALAGMMGISKDALFETIKSLPNITVEEGQNGHGNLTVTWKNWIYYQEDSTVTKRKRKERAKKCHGLRGEEKRREENKRRNTGAPSSGKPSLGDNFEWFIPDDYRQKWQKAFPAVDLDNELQRIASWVQANPDRRKKNWARFVHNWLTKAHDRSRIPPTLPMTLGVKGPSW